MSYSCASITVLQFEKIKKNVFLFFFGLTIIDFSIVVAGFFSGLSKEDGCFSSEARRFLC